MSFPGYPPYLAAAQAALACAPEASDHARRQPALTRFTNLIASADTSPQAAAPGILAEALKSRDALAVAYAACQSMLTDAAARHDLPAPRCLFEHEPTPNEPPRSAASGRRKG